jgi:hypothetical protein
MIIVAADEGQISVDFLLGISVFLLSLGFVIQFIPGLFISTSGEGSLNSVAYRTATILAEDPGWWENNTQNGTDWEMHTGNISRLGLAVDNRPKTRQTQTPNLLNKTKILKIVNSSELNETILTAKLGLFDKISGSQIDYGYNISLEQNGSVMVIHDPTVPITFGKIPPESQDIIKFRRLVLVETGRMAIFRFDELTNKTDYIAVINISGPQSDDVTIQIIDFNISNPNAAKFNWANLNGTLLSIPSDYTAYKRTNNSDFIYSTAPISLENSTDTLRLIFNYILFPANTTYQLELNFTQMNFIPIGPPYIEYADKAQPLYEPATLVVKVWR